MVPLEGGAGFVVPLVGGVGFLLTLEVPFFPCGAMLIGVWHYTDLFRGRGSD